MPSQTVAHPLLGRAPPSKSATAPPPQPTATGPPALRPQPGEPPPDRRPAASPTTGRDSGGRLGVARPAASAATRSRTCRAVAWLYYSRERSWRTANLVVGASNNPLATCEGVCFVLGGYAATVLSAALAVAVAARSAMTRATTSGGGAAAVKPSSNAAAHASSPRRARRRSSCSVTPRPAAAPQVR